MKKKISTIIFDLGNVLLDIELMNFHQKALEIMGINEAGKLRKIEELMLRYELGKINTEVFINGLIRESVRPIQARELIKAWNSILIEMPSHIPLLLLDLRQQYKIYLLSNTNPLHIDWAMKHLKDQFDISDFETNYLHGVFYSHLLQLRKPDPEIYRQVQSRLKISGNEILFIDDLPENVLAAQQAGWHSIRHIPRSPITDTLKLAEIL